MNSTKRYEAYKSHLQKIADLRYAAAVLQWDQETYMPEKGAGFRGKQLATLSEMSHQLFTSEHFKNMLTDLLACEDLDEQQKKNIALSWYDYSQQEKLTGSFVRQLSEASSKSYQSWVAARRENNFSAFAQDLSQIVSLKKQEADLLGYKEHPYDALLNQYERDCTVASLDPIFLALKKPLKDLLDNITKKTQVSNDFLKQQFQRQEQWNFGMYLLQTLGFDFTSGRQDISEHPFTTNFSSQDVRITTRIDENDFSNMTWSCIHECGHALYEQGLPSAHYGLPLSEYTSLGIHESQSRLWENNVGRSYDCWNFFYPKLVEYFPTQFQPVSLEQFYKGINKVVPSPIRTEADELTYHFHVIIRYELEKKLIEGSLQVNDIPAYWNEQYSQLLGVNIKNDREGCLQDVHWSHGSFGYFPTYSLGSFYAVQFFDAAEKQVPALKSAIQNGNHQPLLNWLRTNIHAHGRTYTSAELCKRITGEPLSINYFLQYALDKYSKIYEF